MGGGDDMEIVVRNADFGPVFQAEVYTVQSATGPPLYRIMVGMEGEEIRFQGERPSYVDSSDFLDIDGVGRWVDEQAKALSGSGKKVEMDENFRYQMALVLRDMASESSSMAGDGYGN